MISDPLTAEKSVEGLRDRGEREIEILIFLVHTRVERPLWSSPRESLGFSATKQMFAFALIGCKCDHQTDLFGVTFWVSSGAISCE
jgi:hypothetical protein